MKQIGNYVVEKEGNGHSVRMAGAEEYLSRHNTEHEATEQAKRYQKHDDKRAARR